jgi:hypothetical protein
MGYKPKNTKPSAVGLRALLVNAGVENFELSRA